jgi:hypothetical protein
LKSHIIHNGIHHEIDFHPKKTSLKVFLLNIKVDAFLEIAGAPNKIPSTPKE